MTDVQEILRILGTTNMAHVVIEPKPGATLPYVAMRKGQPHRRVAVSQKSFEVLIQKGAVLRDVTAQDKVEHCGACGYPIISKKGRCAHCHKHA